MAQDKWSALSKPVIGAAYETAKSAVLSLSNSRSRIKPSFSPDAVIACRGDTEELVQFYVTALFLGAIAICAASGKKRISAKVRELFTFTTGWVVRGYPDTLRKLEPSGFSGLAKALQTLAGKCEVEFSDGYSDVVARFIVAFVLNLTGLKTAEVWQQGSTIIRSTIRQRYIRARLSLMNYSKDGLLRVVGLEEEKYV